MFDWLKSLLSREQTSKKEKICSAFLFFCFIFCLGYRANIVTPEQMAWYNTLIKSAYTPPSPTYAIVWPILFAILALAAYFTWNHFKSDRYRKIFIILYFINGILLCAWPQLFFVKHAIAECLYVHIGLIIVTELMILSAFKTNNKAAYLLMPYLLWILFGTYLNISLITLNS